DRRAPPVARQEGGVEADAAARRDRKERRGEEPGPSHDDDEVRREHPDARDLRLGVEVLGPDHGYSGGGGDRREPAIDRSRGPRRGLLGQRDDRREVRVRADQGAESGLRLVHGADEYDAPTLSPWGTPVSCGGCFGWGPPKSTLPSAGRHIS